MTPLLVLAGPTASGKSSLALEVAQQMNGEIVSCDSMQVYRECDIVTAKPTVAERALVPHHLLDVCDPSERFSAAQWAHEATRGVLDIQGRGKVPIVCGGTGFYLRSWLEPASVAAPAPDEVLRAELETRIEAEGADSLRAELSALEPEIAAGLVEGDHYRLVRALQIALQRARGDVVEIPPPPPFTPLVFCLDWPRAELYARIESRVDAMLELGALEELRGLIERWGETAVASGGVGYKQLRPALDNATLLPEAVENWKRDTRRYAKRQLTWFRHQLNAQWLDAHRPHGELARQVMATYRQAQVENLR